MNKLRGITLTIMTLAALSVDMCRAVPRSDFGDRSSGPALILVNSENSADILPLHDGIIVDLTSLPTKHLNIRFLPGEQNVRKVVFGYDTAPRFRVEESSPFALAGNTPHGYTYWSPAIGAHRVTVTTYFRTDEGSTETSTFSTNFEVVESKPRRVATVAEVQNIPATPAPEVKTSTEVPTEVTAEITAEAAPNEQPMAMMASPMQVNFLPAFRINVGGPSFVDRRGRHWQSDNGATEARAFGLTSIIDESAPQPMLSSGRQSADGPIDYAIKVPDGEYQITLHFLAPNFPAMNGSEVRGVDSQSNNGQKGSVQSSAGWVFDVVVEGAPLLKGVDPNVLMGAGNPLHKTVNTRVSDGILNLSVVGAGGTALLNGIEVQPVPSSEVVRAQNPPSTDLSGYPTDQ